MQYHAQITDDVGIQIDADQGLPKVTRLSFDFDAGAEELPKVVEALGGIEAFPRTDPTSSLLSRYGVPLTCDGEDVGRVAIHVWYKAEEVVAPEYEPIRRLLDDGKARAARRGALDA